MSYEQERCPIKLLKQDPMPYLQSAQLKKSGLVDHAFSTRIGGCSSGRMASLNLAYHIGDEQDKVIENRRRFFKYFNYSWEAIAASTQVHGNSIALVSEENRGEGAYPGSAKLQCDALVTEEYGIPITAYSADCMLIYFLVKNKPLIALAHAGWRGALGGIGAKVVNYLKQNRQADSGQIMAALSPSICKKCYTVDDTVVHKFLSAGYSGSSYFEEVAQNRWQFDLAAVNYSQLITAGLKSENIESDSFCTSCNPELFYSYRRDQGDTGRMVGFIALKQ